MINKELLQKAIEIKLEDANKDLKNDINRGRKSEIIYVPVLVEISDNKTIGCMRSYNVMQTYNKLIDKIE